MSEKVKNTLNSNSVPNQDPSEALSSIKDNETFIHVPFYTECFFSATFFLSFIPHSHQNLSHLKSGVDYS